MRYPDRTRDMDVLKVHPDDNVLVALRDLPAGSRVAYEGQTYALPAGAPAKHKVVTRDLAPGDAVVMYGVMVGKCVAAIPRGMAVTSESVVDASQDYGAAGRTRSWKPPGGARGWRDRRFLGYHRSDGQVGTANHWLVIPMVFCENRNVNVLAEAFRKELGYAPPDVYRRHVADLVDRFREGAGSEALRAGAPSRPEPPSAARPVFENVDGIQFLTHEGGCGGTHQDARTLCALLAGYVHNPNVAGATVLALGCEKSQVEMLREELHRRNPAFDKPLLVFEQQRSASEYAMLTAAIHETFAALVEANRLERRPAPLNRLTLGVECGGSDGFSGLSANPAIGHVSDLVAALGGRAILSEFPELSGVEQDIVDRCVSPAVAERFVQLMREYAARARAVEAGFEMNPSPGNVRDGLITIAMKSAGAARKGGTSPVVAVLGYPEYAVEAGLNLLCTPGGDVESTTGLAGAGANVILFSTGLGTPTGNPVTPVIKVSTNTSLARRLPDIIDFDAGPIVTGDKTIEEVGEELLTLVLRVASGEVQPRAVRLGQNDFIPWKRGISL
jgi:altronate hydrolase